MAKKNYLVHLDMNLNQLQNAVLHQLAADPLISLSSEGQKYWNTTTKLERVFDGTAWKNTNTNANYTQGAVTSVTGTLPVVSSNPSAGVYDISVNDATIASSGLMTAIQFALLDGANSAGSADTLVKYDASGNVVITNTPTLASHAATKGYVDNLLASGMKIIGDLDCSTNPNYPAATQGESYKVSVAGKVGGVSGEVVEVGDFIICTVATSAGGDQATVGSDWIVLQRNLNAATTTVSGTVVLASAAEVSAGIGTGVTSVSQVQSMVDVGGVNTRFTTKLALGSTSYTVTHSLGGAVLVQVYNKVTKQYVVTDVTSVDANSVTISVNVALTDDHVAVVTLAGPEPL